MDLAPEVQEAGCVRMSRGWPVQVLEEEDLATDVLTPDIQLSNLKSGDDQGSTRSDAETMPTGFTTLSETELARRG